MIRRWRLRGAFGVGISSQAADSAVGRGMADVLAALNNVIDDDATLERVFAGLGTRMPGAALPLSARTAADDRPFAPAGLPDPARATARAGGPAPSRRRLILRAAAAAAAAMTAGAVALVAVIVPGADHNSRGGLADDTAYVVKRVYSALSAAGPGTVAQMTVTTRSASVSGGTTATTAEEWSYDDRWRAVTYSSSRQRLYDEGFSTASAYTVVSYRTRTWARQHGSHGPVKLAPGPRSCGEAVAPLPLPQPGLAGGLSAGWQPATVAEALRAAVSCGTLAVAGRQRIDAVAAIKLTSRPDSVISETVWVSPGTYLPLRVIIRPAAGQQGPWQTANITWLRPTAQNLARLTVPIPAGFRRIPLAQATAPVMQHTRVWTKA